MCVAGVASPAGRAEAAPYAAIVMDMRDGSVLHSSSADRKQHPASLTKMMTLYLVFEAIRDGQLRLDQKVRVSKHAASMPPSKLHLKVGQRVTIRSLVRAAALKSANDAAVALAEAVAGSESAFAKLMTRRARELGMANTTFKNASGLTRSGHLSTARDMAILGRHLFYDFPQYYNLFGRRHAEAAGRTVWNTNRLLSSYKGADGIKTGYTRAAGYNLVSSAVRGGKRIIAVVMGGKSSRSRNAQMVKLLDLGFSKARSRVAVVKPGFVHSRRDRVAVAEAPMPVAKPGAAVAVAPDTVLARGADVLIKAITPASAHAAVPDPAPVPVASLSPHAPTKAGLPPLRPRAALAAAPIAATAIAPVAAPAPVIEAEPDVAPTPVGGVPLPPKRPGKVVAAAGWMVQIGAFDNHELAVARMTQATLGDLAALSGAEPLIDERRKASGGTRYLVRFVGMSRTGARMACKEIKAHGGDCLAIAPRSGS